MLLSICRISKKSSKSLSVSCIFFPKRMGTTDLVQGHSFIINCIVRQYDLVHFGNKCQNLQVGILCHKVLKG
jgi:hypothetical protein